MTALATARLPFFLVLGAATTSPIASSARAPSQARDDSAGAPVELTAQPDRRRLMQLWA